MTRTQQYIKLNTGAKEIQLVNPPVKQFYWPFQGGTSFVDHLCYLYPVYVMRLRLFIAALLSPAWKGLTSWLSLVMFNCIFVTFPCGILGQVCYLIVSIPDLSNLLTFVSLKGAAKALLSLHLSKFHIVENHIWAVTLDFQQCGMCDKQRLRPACAYAQSDQSLC